MWPVIVVDDGSHDGSARQIARCGFDNLQVIQQPGRGVTATWNAGLRLAKTTYAVLLNNDLVIEGPFMESLLGPLRSEQALITGAELQAEHFLAGWCLAFGRELWRNLGGFDESLQTYWSDTDFQQRTIATCQTATPLQVVASLPLQHLGHRTTGHDPHRRQRWLTDQARYLQKWPS